MNRWIKVELAKKVGRKKYIVFDGKEFHPVNSEKHISDGDYILVCNGEVKEVYPDKPSLSVILKSFFLSLLLIINIKITFAVDVNDFNNFRYFDKSKLIGGNVDKEGIRNFANEQKSGVLSSPEKAKDTANKIGYDEGNLNKDVEEFTGNSSAEELFFKMLRNSSSPKRTYQCYEYKTVKNPNPVYICSLNNSTYTDIVQCNNDCKKVYECKQANCVFAYECEQSYDGNGNITVLSNDLCPINRNDCLFQSNTITPCDPKTQYQGDRLYEKQVLYDTAQAVCYHEPICQTGLDYTYNTDRNRCERQAEYYEEPIIASKHCPSSRQSYNPSTDRCEAFAPAYCPSGYTDVGTYCEKTYPARYVQKTCQEAYSCNPYPCNCYESCSTDEEGNQSCTTVCSTCYETCYRDVDCSYYDCPQGGTLNGTTCVLTAPQECRDAGYVYDASIDQCRDYDPPNCKASNPNAWFYAPTDVCYWYQCDPPKNGTLYTFLQGDKYQGICYEQAVCTFSGIQGFLDGVEDRCELNPCPVGTTPSNGSQVVGNAGRCMLSTKDDVWSDTARTYVWIDKPSPKWQCSPVSCSNRLAPENKAYCLENGVNIQPTSSGQVNTWFCEYENFGGFTNIDACQNGCNWYQCSKDGRWYQGAFYVCEQNCQEQGQCTTLGN